MVRAVLVVSVTIYLAACASRTDVADGIASPTAVLPACAAPPSPADTLWREVRAAGFTFCVPASWRPHGTPGGSALDPHTWRSSSASITWGTGVPPTRLQRKTEIVAMRPGELPPQHTARSPDVRHYTELLGGRTADVSEWHFAELHHTEARWRDPVVYLQGETRSAMMAQLLLAIHRTVRFTPAPPP
jgi:hypothetical protein